MLPGLLLALCVAAQTPASAQTGAVRSFSELGLPAGLSKRELEGLLQRFVDQIYGKGFRRLGDERDFDHGHFLFSEKSPRPLAVLYHTQELADRQDLAEGSGHADARERNWIQWLDRDFIENADRYLRKDYPRTAFWAWFQGSELPALSRHRTIIDKMLDPRLLGFDASRSLQWVFTRVDCGEPSSALDSASSQLRIVLPTRETVCLNLSAV